MPTRTRGRPPHDDHFTPAEWRVLHATRHGMSNRMIAQGMGVSIDAVKFHIRNLLDKTGLRNKKALQLYARQSRQQALGNPVQEHSMNSTQNLTSIGQIARTVSNITVSQQWYAEVLQLPHLYTYGTLAFFDCGGTRLMLSQAEAVNANESIVYFRVNDINAQHATLQQLGVEFIAAPHRIHTHADGTEEWMAFFKDPDARPLALMAQLKPN